MSHTTRISAVMDCLAIALISVDLRRKAALGLLRLARPGLSRWIRAQNRAQVWFL